MGTPFKMKAGKEGPMKKNFPSAFKNDRKKKYKKTKEVMENMSTEELQKVAQRNVEEGVTLQGIRNIDPGVDSRTDSVRSAIEILKLRENK